MSAVDLLVSYRFIKGLVTPFEKWDAFKAGVIDKDGNIIAKKEKRTQEQKDAFGYFDLVILNLKKLLAKLPGGSSVMATYAAAFLLLKEHGKLNEENVEEYIEKNLERDLMESLEQVKQLLAEDGVAANAAGGGHIAGIGIGSKGEPPMKRKKKLLRRVQGQL